MANRKSYLMDAAPIRSPVHNLPDKQRWHVIVGDKRCDINPWRSHKRNKTNAGRDHMVAAMRTALERLARDLSPRSVIGYIRSGVPRWFEYLDHRLDQGTPISSVEAITRDHLEDFAVWLQRRPSRTQSGFLSYGSAKTAYGHLKTVLLDCATIGRFNREDLPDNPFPDSARATVGHKALHRNEMVKVVSALANDLNDIRKGEFRGPGSEKLMVYLLMIAARSGRNTTPLLNLSRDSMREHPLKPQTHSLFTVYKKRGNNMSIQSLRKTREIDDIATVTSDVGSLFQEVLELTEPIRREANPELKNRLWLFKREKAYKGTISVLTDTSLGYAVELFIKRHNLLTDSGSSADSELKLRLNISRLRKTFGSRMWKITGGDILRTAHALGNKPRVTDTHYLEVTDEMVKNHKFVGAILEMEVRGTKEDSNAIRAAAEKLQVPLEDMRAILSGKNNTGVSRCSSPLFGKYAPGDGKTLCTQFLHCFRCPNQVIMQSDLHRLFSFYWLLIRERNSLARNRWHKVYGWVIREIDQVISPRFPLLQIKEARESARLTPHPMWRDRATLGGES
jgi:hypothetical protein